MILLASGFCFADELPEAPAPKIIKRSTKKIEVEEEKEEQPKAVKKVNNSSLGENVSMLSIQQKLKLERQKFLMNALTPMC